MNKYSEAGNLCINIVSTNYIEHKDLIIPPQTYQGATFFHVLNSTMPAERDYDLFLSLSKQH